MYPPSQIDYQKQYPSEDIAWWGVMIFVMLAGIELDRKAMADLAMNEGGVFSAVIAQAKAALG